MALLLLLCFHATSLEAVVGAARDGKVHHESMPEAAAHAAEGGSEHGHEAAFDAPHERHGPDHQHGTGADHCTHVHGPALGLPAANVPVEAVVRLPTPIVAWTPSEFRAAPLFHPPRI